MKRRVSDDTTEPIPIEKQYKLISYCLVYDLAKFCPYDTVLIDHGDPFINTEDCYLFGTF